MDITELILRQHDEQRHAFALLGDIPLDDSAALTAVWSRLEVLLEAHADAEERFFYPRLLEVGKGVGDADGPGEEVKDAISDHNEIREGIRKVRAGQVASEQWWSAVRECREANSDHMAGGGAGGPAGLPPARRSADAARRRGGVHSASTSRTWASDALPTLPSGLPSRPDATARTCWH